MRRYVHDGRVESIEGPWPHHIGGGEMCDPGAVLKFNDIARLDYSENGQNHTATFYPDQEPPIVHIHNFATNEGVEHIVTDQSQEFTAFAISLFSPLNTP